ncbi:LPXTG cell wall anchor domain-containing protein [Lentzea sp.]|uniref:LPXTG cell wall anchor domain-containing protein n=1 Tax=Lentzea sp. TaxID=56099 RepID=UPI002BE76BD9|nr:LPXTG cell wall anchor domain-containing protein [Lentzea sp.]HUQ57781.1 LPXTG cell wall anchor domain-containing protein [Lentzea sp.]
MINRASGSIAALGISALAVLGSATVASAHTPVLSASCVADKAVIAVQLTDYNAGKDNELIVTDNGAELVSANFGSSHRFQRELDGAAGHRLVVEVKAWDDPDSEQGWSFTKTLDVPQCVKVTTTAPPVQTTTPAPTPSSPTPSQVVTSPTSSEPVSQLVGDETPAEPLAATGASPLWLLVGGAALLGAGGAALFVARRRRA